tara:strand:+ start:7539 stop:8369 length:831 start_codon:yes stop_codon:yes gene_type:complete
MRAQFLKLICLLFLCLSVFDAGANNDTDMIKRFDQNQYSPIKYGLKEVVFEARVSGLEESIKNRYALTKLNDLHFSVYWLSPGRVEIEVIGLPPGFDTLKQELKRIIYERLEYVVPQDLSGRLRGYNFESSRMKNSDVLLKGKDETHSKAISQINLVFAQDSSLKSMKTFSPSGSQTAVFKSEVKPWSHSKRVVTQVSVEGVTGIQKTIVETAISYVAKDGFGVPQSIKTNTKVEAMTNKDGAQHSTISSEILLSDYKINTGTAQKYFAGRDAKQK